MFSRVLIKLSGEALAGSQTNPPFDDVIIDNVVRQIKAVAQAGTQVALVLGGGNFWRGRQARPDMDRARADQIGMLATVMNALYLAESFKRQAVNAVVTAPIPIGTFTELYERDEVLRKLKLGTVVINAAGLGHPFFSTDTITALRAAELDADCILYAKSVDGVYDSDPRKNPAARKYRSVSYQTALVQNLNVADMAALHLSREAGIPSYVFGLDEPESIVRACAYPETGALRGTYIAQSIELKECFYV